MAYRSKTPRLSNQGPIFVDNPNSSFGVEQALSNWKVWRATLATAVQGYLAACTDLTTVCAQPLTQLSRRHAIELALGAVDSELVSLTSEQEALHQAINSLATARNTATSLSPLHALPPEIITRIFSAVHLSCFKHDKPLLRAAHSLAGVSSYWRRIAIDMRYLWSHIRLSPRSKNYEYAQLLLERSNGYPLQFYTIATDEVLAKDDLYWEDLNPRLEFITKVAPHIGAMDISLLADYTEPLEKVLEPWFQAGSGHPSRSLKVHRLHEEPIPMQWDWETFLDPDYDSALKSISVLHLTHLFIPWDSFVFHGLVDLSLSFDNAAQLDITTSEFGNILRACPELEILKIRGGLEVEADDWSTSVTIQLPRLETLCLIELSHNSYRALLPLLSLADCKSGLAIRLDIENAKDIADVVHKFIRHAPIKTFVCDDSKSQNGLQWPFSLLPLMPSLENLILVNYGTPGLGTLETMVSELESRSNEDQDKAKRLHILPHLYLTCNDLESYPEYIHTIVPMYGVQNLHLEHCGFFGLRSSQETKMADLTAALAKAFPNLVCIATRNDTTEHWPCRRVL